MEKENVCLLKIRVECNVCSEDTITSVSFENDKTVYSFKTYQALNRNWVLIFE